MWWEHGTGYGTHGERAIVAPASRGTSPRARRTADSTCSTCCRTPDTAAEVRARYLRPSGTPLEKTYDRSTGKPVQHLGERGGTARGIRHTPLAEHGPLGAVRRRLRAIHRRGARDVPDASGRCSSAGSTFEAGHESAGVNAPPSRGSSPRARPATSSISSSSWPTLGDTDAIGARDVHARGGQTLTNDLHGGRRIAVQHLGRSGDVRRRAGHAAVARRCGVHALRRAERVRNRRGACDVVARPDRHHVERGAQQSRCDRHGGDVGGGCGRGDRWRVRHGHVLPVGEPRRGPHRSR